MRKMIPRGVVAAAVVTLALAAACEMIDLEGGSLDGVQTEAVCPGCDPDSWETECTFVCEFGGYEVQVRRQNGGPVYYDVEPTGYYDWETEESIATYYYVPESAYHSWQYNWWDVTELNGVTAGDCLCGNTGNNLTGRVYQIEIHQPAAYVNKAIGPFADDDVCSNFDPSEDLSTGSNNLVLQQMNAHTSNPGVEFLCPKRPPCCTSFSSSHDGWCDWANWWNEVHDGDNLVHFYWMDNGWVDEEDLPGDFQWEDDGSGQILAPGCDGDGGGGGVIVGGGTLPSKPLAKSTK